VEMGEVQVGIQNLIFTSPISFVNCKL
jgi:hypothetical protein